MTGHARKLPRPDKWYLGCGDGLVHAPPFPQWLDVGGLWDEAHLFQYPVGPLFAVTFVEEGQPLAARATERAWTPDGVTVRHTLPGLQAVERRAALGDWSLGSRWSVRNRTRRRRTLDIVVWTAWPGDDVDDHGVTWRGGTLALTRRVRDRMGHETSLTMRLVLEPRARRAAAMRSEGALPPPRFEITPFWDRWTPGGLARGVRLEGISAHGVVYAALARRISVPPAGRAGLSVGARFELSSAPRRRLSSRRTRHRSSPSTRHSPGSWEGFLAGVPSLTSEPLLDWAWYNRWHGLRLNRVPAVGQYEHPSVCEGIAYFHQPIAYSAPCHARELRWAHDPRWAHGVLRTFLGSLRSDGGMHGRRYVDHDQRTDFYHGDWGAAVEAVLGVHPDERVARELYDGLARYARWLVATRDAEGSGMIDVVDQYETGQEYMSRYLAVDPDADRYGWENRIRLKGIDVTVYAYRIFQALARHEDTDAGRSRGDPQRDLVPSWRVLAQRTARAVREQMWDPDLAMFSDVDPASGCRTGVKAAVCFYPYMTDLVGEEHLAGLERHLFDPREFWTPFPVPSSSRDDARFDPDALWRGKRHNCPWNGRVWPMTNSHVAEALARVVRERRRRWAGRYARFLRRFFTMMTFDGRADRPNAFEHYHPLSGKPSAYRGIDDYQHSWLLDLIVSHVFGFTPMSGDRFAVDPIPIGLERARLIDLPYRGQRVRLQLTRGRIEVAIDGRRAASGRVGAPLEVSL